MPCTREQAYQNTKHGTPQPWQLDPPGNTGGNCRDAYLAKYFLIGREWNKEFFFFTLYSLVFALPSLTWSRWFGWLIRPSWLSCVDGVEDGRWLQY